MISTITRSCSECSRLSSVGTCVDGVEDRPGARALRQCLGFIPLPEVYDDRTGRQLWPEKANFTESGEPAQGFLAALLGAGAMESAEVIAEAAAAGIPMRTIQRAAEQLCVVRTKEGFGEGWKWALPSSEDAKA